MIKDRNKNKEADDQKQDESDEFFEANSSVTQSDNDLETPFNNDKFETPKHTDEEGFQLYINNKHKNREARYTADHNVSNLKHVMEQPKLLDVKAGHNDKMSYNDRKDSNNSNQSTISIKSNNYNGKEENAAKKSNKKSNSSSSFSKIKFRDRSNTKNSTASSNAVLTDSSANHGNPADFSFDNVDHTYANDEDGNFTNSNIGLESNNNGFYTTISDTNNYLLNALEEQDELRSPTLDEDGNNLFFGSQNKKGTSATPTIQQQKTSTMAKYRSGKFSSTLTNLLPNISAKLHHSKNRNPIDSTSQPSTPSSDGGRFFNENAEMGYVVNSQSAFSQDAENFNQKTVDNNKKKLQLDSSNFNNSNSNNNVELVDSTGSLQLQQSSEKISAAPNENVTTQNNSTSTKSKILAMMGSSSSKKQLQLQKQLENEKKAEKAKKMLVDSISGTSSSFSHQHHANEKNGDLISASNQLPIPFPKNNESLLHVVNTNQSGYHQIPLQENQMYLNRTRTNTVSSQITSLSNVPSYPMWSNIPNQDTGSYQYDVSSVISSNIMPQQQYNMPQMGGSSSLAAAANWRPRSKSNASNSMVNDLNYNRNHSGSYQSLVNTKSIIIKDFQYVENLDVTLAPIMHDDVEPASFNWITNYPYAPKINYVNKFLQPTNTICVSNIFSIQKTQNLPNFINLTSFCLNSLFSQFGEILTIKTLYGLNLALLEFKYVESAKMAIDSMNGKLISTSIPSDVVFAKIIPLSISLETDVQNRFLLTEQLYNGSLKFINHGQWTIPTINGYLPAHKEVVHNQNTQAPNIPTSSENHNSHYQHHSSSSEVVIETDLCPFTLPPPNLLKTKSTMGSVFRLFGEGNCNEKECIKTAFDNVINIMNNDHLSTDPTNYGPQPAVTSAGSLPADGKRKIFDSPTLRDLRKALDNKSITDLEIEQICICMLDEIAELCSDYLGNTIIQRIFESSTPLLKNLIINNCSQYLTSISVHKNGTWAAQKLISGSSDLINNKVAIANGIKPYCLPLFTDQFGNYVIQCCLKYGPPFNNFIYDNIIKNFWGIVKSRFGSRAVRAVLESSNLEETYNNKDSNSCKIITKRQLYSITSLVVTYCEYLATNSNGTLLLTWFLDTCVIPNRLEILSKQMVKNIVPLATHKLASLTLIKLLNQRKDDGSSKNVLLNSIFGDIDTATKIDCECNLVNILKESKGNGTQFILKVLSLSLIDLKFKQNAIMKIHEILVSTDPNMKEVIEVIKKDKKFIEELGLGTATPVNNSFDDFNTNSSNKRNRALSHVFKETGNNMSNDGSHNRNSSVGSSNNNSTNNNNTRNRGYSNSQRMNNGSSGSIWE